VFNISSVSGGSGAPYQTSYVITGNPPSWNNFPATNSYTGLCGGTSYTLCLKGSAGDTRCADPDTQCSYTTTTTTAAPATTTTSTTGAPAYYYYALSTCWGQPTSIAVGRSLSSSYGTAVFLIGGICFQSNGITSGPSYDVDLDAYSIIPGGCSDAACTTSTTTTTAAPTTTTTVAPTTTTTTVGFYYNNAYRNTCNGASPCTDDGVEVVLRSTTPLSNGSWYSDGSKSYQPYGSTSGPSYGVDIDPYIYTEASSCETACNNY
jgi:hypothetical protein